MQAYLPLCLQSLMCKNRDVLEIIVVNDGSKDNTLKIANQFAKDYPTIIKVIDKFNGNYGSCINRGLKEASGKYVKILDADDCFDTESLDKYIEELTKTKAELVINDFVKVWSDKEKQITSSLQSDSDLDFINVCNQNKHLWNIQMHQVCYLRTMLLNICYHQTEGISYTDQEWTFAPLSAVRTVKYIPVPLYRYTLGREGQSVSAQFGYKHFGDNITCTSTMLREMSQMKDLPKSIYQLLQYKLFRRCKYIYRTYLLKLNTNDFTHLKELDAEILRCNPQLYHNLGKLMLSTPLLCIRFISLWRKNPNNRILSTAIKIYRRMH